ncbi:MULTISPECIES: dihydrofolate reductase family protein [unclassified Jeotgalibaca]|uniref:dihydrofolate reductase family protein n=1 Tax=unclassified Jeotgalibaca TaxID=2621505 RepID=UPI003FD0F106
MSNRKISLDLAVTLDGFIEGQNGEIDWCILDDEMAFGEYLNQIETVIMGRKSYDVYRELDDTSLAKKEILVFSRTRHGAEYLSGAISEKMAEIKARPGKGIWLYGGSELITAFVNEGLIDEYRLSIHPVILGAGKPLFVAIKNRVELKLVETNVYKSGVVQHIYRNKD